MFWLRCDNVPLQPLPGAAGPDLAIRLHAEQLDAHDNPAAEETFLGRRVERSAVVLPGLLGAEQTLPLCPLQTVASGGRPPRLLIQGCFEMDNRSI